MLYIVATPIGNLKDITLRAIEVLKSVDVILAEDTKCSNTLLVHYNIINKMRSFNEHNERQKTKLVISELLNNKNIALISDAGTPLISDPGYVLVREAKKAKIKVVPIPGASAVISALSVSAIASDSFSFLGFLPNKHKARLKFINELAPRRETVILYESPRRILATMLDLQACLGNKREVCIARELTKIFESINSGFLPELIAYIKQDSKHQKGEFVILIAADTQKNKLIEDSELNKMLTVLLAEMNIAKAAKLAAKFFAIDKKYCYEKALNL